MRRPARERAVVLHVCVPAEEHVCVHRTEHLEEIVLRSDARVDGFVGSRRRVADENSSETFDVQLERQRPGVRRREPLVPQQVGTPGSKKAEPRAATHHLVFGVPSDNMCAETSHDVEHLDRRRTDDRVSDDDHGVHALTRDVREHCFERRQVAVDVADRGDAHRPNLTREREARPGADEVERRAVGADELARRRSKVAGADACDRTGELGFELGDVSSSERRRHDGVRPLEELVGDLDLGRPGPQAHERIDESLQRGTRPRRCRAGLVLRARSTCSRRSAPARPPARGRRAGRG